MSDPRNSSSKTNQENKDKVNFILKELNIDKTILRYDIYKTPTILAQKDPPVLSVKFNEGEFVDIKNGWVRLLFSGECGSCVVSASTLLLIEEMVCTAMPEIKGVERIRRISDILFQ